MVDCSRRVKLRTAVPPSPLVLVYNVTSKSSHPRLSHHDHKSGDNKRFFAARPRRRTSTLSKANVYGKEDFLPAKPQIFPNHTLYRVPLPRLLAYRIT